MKESLGQKIARLRKEKNLDRADVVRGARVSVPTLVQIQKNMLPEIKSSSHRKLVAWARTITRIACFFGEEPGDWLSVAGFDIKSVWVQEIIANNGGMGGKNARSIFEASFPLTSDDLKFLESVMLSLKQPLTFGLAFELVRRRAPSDSSKSS